MLSSFETFVNKNKLFTKKDKLLLAISGGKDSVCLFHLLQQGQYNFELAHCNYQLREKDSDKDESFVKRLASKYGIKLHVKRFETREEVLKSKTGIQETARKLRYQWFEYLRSTEKFDFVLTAHHLSDNTETILINIFRSGGISGLHGIPLKNVHVVRPLMFADSAQIDEFVKKQRIKYREDISNSKDDYLRNKIRHKIIPSMLRVDERTHELFNSLSSKIRDYETMTGDLIKIMTEKHIHKSGNKILIDDAVFEHQTNPDVLLFHILKSYGFNRSDTENFKEYSKLRIGSFIQSNNWKLVRERGGFNLIKLEENQVINYQISDHTNKIDSDFFELSINKIKPKKVDFTNKQTLYFDLAKCRFPLVLRTWKKGDKIRPLGMKGDKKISDILTDKKIQNADRPNQLVICDQSGKLMGLLPSTCGEAYKMDSSTTAVLALSLKII